MSENGKVSRAILWSVIPLILLVVSINMGWTHCDAINGPVAVAAKEALKSGRFETIAIWVGGSEEDELRRVFTRCVPVYKKGGEAQALAERYFIETAVRLHRESEGFPFKGLKPEQVLPPDIATAEKALETGTLKPVTDFLSYELQKEVQRLFHAVQETHEHKDASVEAGRKWVDAYVRYIIYIHGLYDTIQKGPEHGLAE